MALMQSTIREDDRVIEVRMTQTVIMKLCIANKMVVQFVSNENTVRVMGRTATGVRGMSLR